MISKILVKVLDKICRVFNQLKIPWMIMGGMASSVWGEPRATYDIDFSILLEEGQLPRLFNTLKKRGFYFEQEGLVRVIQNLQYLTLSYRAGKVKIYIDIFLARSAYQYEALLRRRKIVFQHRELFFISPEDLILYKLLSGRGRDIDDVREILVTKRQDLNMRYLTRWAKKLGVLTLLKDEIRSLSTTVKLEKKNQKLIKYTNPIFAFFQKKKATKKTL